ncbi:MAG: hypothetical protein GKC10_06415 [Methanosarcinales archaeon]|nr:hypothetical protein [Methanosarcinales archaeon]
MAKKGKKKAALAAQEKSSRGALPPGTEAQSQKPKEMPRMKTPAERRKSQMDGLKKTIVPSVLGLAAGFVSYMVLGMGMELPWHFIMLNVILATLIIQRLIYPPLGINVLEFKSKDWFYVEFIAVDLWLVSWTILLN